jgi:hypothetical protein
MLTCVESEGSDTMTIGISEFIEQLADKLTSEEALIRSHGKKNLVSNILTIRDFISDKA